MKHHTREDATNVSSNRYARVNKCKKRPKNIVYMESKRGIYVFFKP